MITCIINGHKAYPTSTSSIKVTYANQYVTDDGEYTYDITFPMSILENREIFKNVSRFEVKKSLAKYDDCKLYCNGLLIMSGVGTVLSINQNEVKLQLLGGKSRIKYNSRFDKLFIDEMDLGAAVHGFGLGTDMLLKVKDETAIAGIFAKLTTFNFYQTLSFGPVIGVEGQYVYTPIHDETNDITANMLFGKKGTRYIYNLAVQPNLIYILHLILWELGYKVERDDFAKAPWNSLYIASAYKSTEFRHALPHWTAYTFLEEFRKLFNAKIKFDEARKTVCIIGTSEFLDSDVVEYEALDEFSVDYDEDGSLNVLDTSNVEYNLDDTAARDSFEVIPQKILSYFDVYELDGVQPNLDPQIQKWDLKKKRTTIVRRRYSDGSLQDYYIWKADESDDTKGSWAACGEFSPLIHNQDSDDSITLNISPASVSVMDVDFTILSNWVLGILGGNKDVRPRYMLSANNDKEAESKGLATDEDGYSYVTVEDAMEDDSNLDDEEDENQCLPIYFLGDKLHNPVPPLPSDLPTALPSGCLCDNAMGDNCMAWPIPITDDVHLAQTFGETKGWSLSLVQHANDGIRDFHGKAVIDSNDCMEIKFHADDIPDPSKIFVFHGKRFVCSKIEVEIKDGGIEPIKTGYFYMMS